MVELHRILIHNNSSQKVIVSSLSIVNKLYAEVGGGVEGRGMKRGEEGKEEEGTEQLSHSFLMCLRCYCQQALLGGEGGKGQGIKGLNQPCVLYYKLYTQIVYIYCKTTCSTCTQCARNTAALSTQCRNERLIQLCISIAYLKHCITELLLK